MCRRHLFRAERRAPLRPVRVHATLLDGGAGDGACQKPPVQGDHRHQPPPAAALTPLRGPAQLSAAARRVHLAAGRGPALRRVSRGPGRIGARLQERRPLPRTVVVTRGHLAARRRARAPAARPLQLCLAAHLGRSGGGRGGALCGSLRGAAAATGVLRANRRPPAVPPCTVGAARLTRQASAPASRHREAPPGPGQGPQPGTHG
mmetsp:Transcript_82077/g.199198  ORF Transcript_82077/g.199198 Transcript_82077/m.199198 type:complete len:205 (-) Transcript_82077:487-1101(-)